MEGNDDCKRSSYNTTVSEQWRDLLKDTPLLLHFAKKLDVRIWPILRINP